MNREGAFKLISRIPLIWLVLASTFILYCQSEEASAIDCPFNSMCTCVEDENELNHGHLQNVHCLDVTFYKFPNISSSSITQLEIVGSCTSSLDGDSLASQQIQTLILSNNQIRHISEKALSFSTKSLTSLDLSYNQLNSVPFQSLRDLRNLQWINLQGNQISSVIGHWSHLQETLTTLFLGENDITELSGELQLSSNQLTTTLRQLKSLLWLNLDENQLRKIPKHSLPRNLKTLSVTNNLIETFPQDAILSTPHLQWLYLRGNQIKTIPEHTFQRKLYLEKIDISANYLKDFSVLPFNHSTIIKDFNLASNDLKILRNASFFGLQTRKIVLAYNSISFLETDTFRGVEDYLEYLDLDHNNLKIMPIAVKALKLLKYLYFSGNELKNLPDDIFVNMQDTLRAIAFSNNNFKRIPSKALRNCSRIVYLSAAFNEIHEIDNIDFENWGTTLQTLALNNNRISYLRENTFLDLKELKELSLSYNPITVIEENSFFYPRNLESLDLSYSIENDEFPLEMFNNLENLRILSIDHNNFQNITTKKLDLIPSLTYLNMDYNSLRSIPSNLFQSGNYQNLKDIRLSNNEITQIPSGAFYFLDSIETIVLSDNKISSIESESFSNLPQIKEIHMSYNRIKRIDAQAFKNLTSIEQLNLQYNQMGEISFEIFENVGNIMILNLSHNFISSCFSQKVTEISILDIASNNLDTIPDCLKSIKNFKQVILDHNKISSISYDSFKGLLLLEKLSIRHNNILAIDKAGFHDLKNLQILDLTENYISFIHTGQFSHNSNLRILKLNNNNINHLPRDVFINSALEMIDLTLNSLSIVPTTSLADIKLNLRHLSLSGNNLEHVDITSFPDFPFLDHLDLSKNRLTILPDNVFTSLNSLQILDLSSNAIRANFKELFHYAQNLKQLNLADVGMISTPQLHLPNLLHLNLSHNSLHVINRNTFQDLTKLRILDLSSCSLSYVPNHIWMYLPNLKNLDISHNPIKEISADSFLGLRSLKSLNLHHLKGVQKFQGRSFTQLRILAELFVQTVPNIENFYQEFCYILTQITQLKVLRIIFQEHELANQLACLSNKRLTNLEITGRNLRIVQHTAFQNVVNSPSLSVKISGTMIDELPRGLFSNMMKIPYLTVDLSNNILSTLSPETFYGNVTTWDSVGTSAISGGLHLAGNRFRCGCHLAWLGHWLRRWTRESIQAHSVPVELSLRVRDISKEATCWDSSLEKHVPVVELPPVDMSCQASALSSKAERTKLGVLVTSVIFFGVLRTL